MAKLDNNNCCSPAREHEKQKSSTLDISARRSISCEENAVNIPGGRSVIGTMRPILRDDGEGPLQKSKIQPFRISATTITNSQYRQFVDETGYITEAEQIGSSFVFWAQVPKQVGDTQAVANAQWWRLVEGANWQDINGPGTKEEAFIPDHPVVHISWNDAQAYAKWAGGRLPTEAEWEHAARGGRGDVRFPWGDQEPDDNTFLPCNIWQGRFPQTNTGADNYVTTAPAKSFEPNDYGLYNMVGNVWEWAAEPFKIKSLKTHIKRRLEGMKGYKLMKGGSFLCHSSYCYRYRIAARTGTSPDSSTTHQSFRVVWDV